MPDPSYENEQETWACDTSISMPEAPKVAPAIQMAGFAFTVDGIVHGVTEVDLENMRHPTFGPERIGHV